MFVVPYLPQPQCLNSITNIQDGVHLESELFVLQFLRQHFTYERTISRVFPITWPSRSSNCNSCYFWLWGHYGENPVFREPLVILADLKLGTIFHVRNTLIDQLRPASEQVVHRLQNLHLPEVNHIEQHSLRRYDPYHMNVRCIQIKCV